MQGRLEAYDKSYGWGTVCDDNFDRNDAKVVCKIFKRFSIRGSTTQIKYGTGTGPLLFDEVECYGWKEELAHCSHRGVGVSDCTHAEDVAIYCQWE